MRHLLAGLFVIAAPAAAQRVTPQAGVWLAEHRVDAGSGVEVTTGPVFEMGATAGFGSRWGANLEVVGGTLSGSGTTADRDFAQLRLAAGYQLTSWLGLGAGFVTRAFSTTLARQRWTTLYGEASMRLPFALNGLAGIGTVAFAPAVSVSELPSPGPTIHTAAGIEYNAGRLGLLLSYGLERHTFAPQGGSIRKEQFSALMLRLAWRLTR